jgi:Tfp pilus assembly protein PilO
VKVRNIVIALTFLVIAAAAYSLGLYEKHKSEAVAEANRQAQVREPEMEAQAATIRQLRGDLTKSQDRFTEIQKQCNIGVVAYNQLTAPQKAKLLPPNCQ